jgi:hypothetical protein
MKRRAATLKSHLDLSATNLMKYVCRGMATASMTVIRILVKTPVE